MKKIHIYFNYFFDRVFALLELAISVFIMMQFGEVFLPLIMVFDAIFKFSIARIETSLIYLFYRVIDSFLVMLIGLYIVSRSVGSGNSFSLILCEWTLLLYMLSVIPMIYSYKWKIVNLALMEEAGVYSIREAYFSVDRFLSLKYANNTRIIKALRWLQVVPLLALVAYTINGSYYVHWLNMYLYWILAWYFYLYAVTAMLGIVFFIRHVKPVILRGYISQIEIG